MTNPQLAFFLCALTLLCFVIGMLIGLYMLS